MEAGAIRWMMLYHGCCTKESVPWEMSQLSGLLNKQCGFFHSFPENLNFAHFAGSLAMSTHGSYMCAFHTLGKCWNQKHLWSITALRSPGKPLAVTSPATVPPQGWRLPAPREGQWKAENIPALQLLRVTAKTTDEGGSVLMSQAGIQSGWGTCMSHVASLLMGSCSRVGQGSICHLKEFEQMTVVRSSGACCRLERSSKQALLNC